MKISLHLNRCYMLCEETYNSNKDIIKPLNDSFWLDDVDVESHPYEEPADRDFHMESSEDKYIMHRKFLSKEKEIKWVCTLDDTDPLVETDTICGLRPVVSSRRVEHSFKPGTSILFKTSSLSGKGTILKNGDILIDKIVGTCDGRDASESLEFWFELFSPDRVCEIESEDDESYDWSVENTSRDKAASAEKLDNARGIVSAIVITLIGVGFVAAIIALLI